MGVVNAALVAYYFTSVANEQNPHILKHMPESSGTAPQILKDSVGSVILFELGILKGG